MSTREIEQLAHRLLLIGFDGVEAPPAEALPLLRGGVAGTILFARNVRDPAQVALLNRRIKEAASLPVLSSVDQEGGRVARLRSPWATWAPLRRWGETLDAGLVRALGAALAEQVSSCGFDLDYAPVLDVDSNPDNPIIGDRSLGRDPAEVGRLGAALVEGLQGAGVAACGKHFPGHGDTSQDSHLTLPRLVHDLERLRALELVPFRAAIAAGVSSIMTAHVVFEALEPGVPATMSPAAIDGLLRRELGYEGVVISDDLEMKAVHGQFDMADVVERALGAGVDAFLVCSRTELAHEVVGHVCRAVESGRVSRARLEQAAARVDVWVRRWARPAAAIDPDQATIGAASTAHRELSARVAAVRV